MIQDLIESGPISTGPPRTLPLFDEARFQPVEIEVCTGNKDAHQSGLEHLDDWLLKRAWPIRHNKVIQRIAEAGMPAPGEVINLVTLRYFSGIELIDYVVTQEGPVEECALVVYSISQVNAVRLVAMKNKGRIKNLQILISAIRNTAVRQKENAVCILRNDPSIDLFFAHSHAKILLFKTSQGNHYTITGSGNLGNNDRIEQYDIFNDRELYEWNRSWMREVKAEEQALAAEAAAARPTA